MLPHHFVPILRTDQHLRGHQEALGGPPTLAGFSPAAYENILLPHTWRWQPVYGSSYFIPAPREFKTQYPFQSTLRLIQLMLRTGLPVSWPSCTTCEMHTPC